MNETQTVIIVFVCVAIYIYMNIEELAEYNDNENRNVNNNLNNNGDNDIQNQYFCDFNADGCKSDNVTGDITVKLLQGGEKVVNAHYFKYEPAVGTKVSAPLIISLAYGYRWNKLRVFITSARKSGYDGSIFLFVDLNYTKTSLPYYFNKYNVTPLLLEENWPFYSDLNTNYPIDKESLNKCMNPDRDYTPYKWVVYRVSLLTCFLKQYRKLFSHILYMDCRDILFQWNPFAWNIQPALYLVEETDANYCIGVDPFDSQWVNPYKDGNHIYNCRVLNSGSIFGNRKYFFKFIKRFNAFIKHEYISTAEQGTLNFVFYTQNWTHIPILMNRNGYGFALTLAVDLVYRPDDSFFPYVDMYIYNKDGTKPCFIHQYERKMEKYKEWEDYRTDPDEYKSDNGF